MTADPSRLVSRKIALARLALWWEDALSRLFPALMVVGLALLAVLTGVLSYLPGEARWIVLGALAAGFLWQLRHVAGLRWPDEAAALARVERMSRLKGRPASALRDSLADPGADAETRALWEAHRARAARSLDGLKAGAPRSPLPRLDPNALRNGLAIAVLAAAFLNLGQWRDRVAETLRTAPAVAAVPAALDAWVSPPAYTGKPPLLLTGRLSASRDILVPEGSTLAARVSGAAAAAIVLSELQPDGSPGAALATVAPETASADLKVVLDRPVHAAVTADGRELAAWPIALIPDAAPVAAIEGPLDVTPTGAFAIPWKATDDYGVTGLAATVELAEVPDNAGIDRTSPILAAPPGFPITLGKSNPTEASGRAFQDLTAHPWAGLTVDLKLIARDQAGQTGTSDPVTFKLPERPFAKLLARALVEQRRKLFFAPAERLKVVRALTSLVAWPDGLIETSGVYLGIRTVANRLYRNGDEATMRDAADTLWEIALTVEDGNLSAALKNLEAIRKELEKALAEGAPEERIAELMDQLRRAMDEYLAAMQRQMMEALRNNPQAFDQLSRQGQPGEEIRSQDLQRMMDMIENLARSGARDAARELLSQLENILRNLQPGMPQMADPSRQPPLARMLDQLADMMRRQQELMDRTFRMPQGGRNQPGQPQDGQEPGSRGSQSQGDPSEGLAGQQGELGQMLQRLLDQLAQQGLGQPGGLDRAQRGMDDATGELGRGEREGALGSQGEALEGLREGARNMAQELMQQGTGNEGNFGRHGEARGDQRDPLGRPLPSRGEDLGPRENMVPTEAAVERARRILEALRNRASEPSRPRLELDYLDRLLRGLY